MSTSTRTQGASFTERLVRGPEGFRNLLERLGPTYIKVGQFLALRPDLISQEYCDELMLLFDRVPGFPWATANAILQTELGRDPASVFAYINPVPVAAGSLAQTHYARLLDGTQVAIKIQRPGIREKVLRDLRRARLMVRFIEASGAGFIVSPRETVREVTSWMLQEIDFVHELANLTRLYELSSTSRNEKVPRPYPELSTSRVLTAEFIQGIPFTELLSILRSEPISGRSYVLARGVDAEQLATNVILASLNQIFRYQFFHADLHPGNLMALPGNVVGFVDFGLCDELDPIVRERQMRSLYAIATDNPELMYRALTEILIPSDETDLERFRRDFLDQTSDWQRQRTSPAGVGEGSTSRYQRSPTSQWMINVMRAARRHRLTVPPRVLSLYRALLTAESVATQLGTDVDLQSVGQGFFESLQVDEALRALRPDAIPPYLLSVFELVRRSPAQLEQLLSELADGRFTLHTVTTESPRTAGLHNRRTRLLVAAVVSVGMAILLARPDLPNIGDVSAVWPLAAMLGLIYAWILVQLQRLR